ncbi:hypothetical protein LINPERHAP1_LOCUS4977 [Linum perenne]
MKIKKTNPNTLNRHSRYNFSAFPPSLSRFLPNTLFFSKPNTTAAIPSLAGASCEGAPPFSDDGEEEARRLYKGTETAACRRRRGGEEAAPNGYARKPLFPFLRHHSRRKTAAAARGKGLAEKAWQRDGAAETALRREGGSKRGELRTKPSCSKSSKTKYKNGE